MMFSGSRRLVLRGWRGMRVHRTAATMLLTYYYHPSALWGLEAADSPARVEPQACRRRPVASDYRMD